MTSSLLLICIAGLIIAARVGSSRRALVAKPDHHHWIVRLLCVVLFVAALIALGMGTWQATHEEVNSPQVTVMVPTKSPRPISSPANMPKIDLGPSKLIGTVLLVSKEQDRLVPLCGESLTLGWPPEASAKLVFHGAHGGANYTVTMDLRDFDSIGQDGDIRTQNGFSIEMKGATWSSSGSGYNLALDTMQTQHFGNGWELPHHAPLSLIPSDEGADLRLLIHLARADNNDPLEKLPADPWLARQAGKPRQDEPARLNSYPGVRFDAKLPPGIRMLDFLGPSAFLLLIAAIAGAACARRGRRAFAFAGLLALMVLYAGLLDEVVLRRRAGLTNDTGRPESVRALALGGMLRGTYFHRGAALARLREIAADPSIPEALRQDARAMAQEGRSALTEGRLPNRPGP